MTIDLQRFKQMYDRWVEESLPDFRAGRVLEAVKRYSLIVSDWKRPDP